MSLAQCNAAVDRGKVVSWLGSKNLWKTNNISMEKFKKGSDSILCPRMGKLDFNHLLMMMYVKRNVSHYDIIKLKILIILDQGLEYYSVVFPERRSLEMAETICKLHGGHLPVPTDDTENNV